MSVHIAEHWNLANTVDNFLAGKTALALTQWEKITGDPWVLSTISGVIPELLFTPRQWFTPSPIKFSDKEKEIVESEVLRFLDRGIIRPAIKTDSQNQFISTIFPRLKPDGTYRLILNLKQFNLFAKYTHFKMDGLQEAIYLMRQDCFFTSIDLKDAYYSILIEESMRKYFRFEFDSNIYEFNALVMGYSDAPRIFTKVLKPILSHLRGNGVGIVMYIDDALIVQDSFDACTASTKLTASWFDKLGFTIHMAKSSLVPAKQITHLGFWLDSESMTVRPTNKKAEAIKTRCFDLLGKQSCTIRELAEVIGILVAVAPGNRFATVFYKRLEILKSFELSKNRGNYEAIIHLPAEAIEDLKWWTHNTDNYPVFVRKSDTAITMTSDASSSGWGGECKGETTGGLWTGQEQESHINCLELKAALFTLQAFGKNLKSCHILLQSDNTTTVACINKMGSTKPECNNVAREIWLWCINTANWVTAVHLPGVDNAEADAESRQKGLETEWALNDQVFLDLEKAQGPFEVGLFASPGVTTLFPQRA